MAYHKPTHSATPPEHYTLIYDGECPFCKETSRRIQRKARKPVDIVPYEDSGWSGMLVDLTPEEVKASVHFVTPKGIEYHGGEGAVLALSLVPGGSVLKVLNLPGLSYLRELGYDVVTEARPLLSRFIHG